jgi:hypothetical protein
MRVRMLTEGLGVIEGGTKASQGTVSNKQRAAATKQGIMRLSACYENILEGKKKYLSHQSSMLDFFKSASGALTWSPVLLGAAADDPDDPPTVQDEAPLT